MRVLLFSSCLLLLSCEREERHFDEKPAPVRDVQIGSLTPGNDVSLSGPVHYEENAYAVNEGKRLYAWFNCQGCHAQGGGGMGPALMDLKWRYGNSASNIYATIVEGRPNGMPSFRGKIPEEQIWQLTAYVRSLAGLVRSDVAPGRDDHLNGKKPESRLEEQPPTPDREPHP